MSEPINLTKIGPVVDLTFVGEVHFEKATTADGKPAAVLIVGDTKAMDRFQAAYGGYRQMGEVRLVLHLLTSPTIEVSPSGGGVFSESSEPA